MSITKEETGLLESVSFFARRVRWEMCMAMCA